MEIPIECIRKLADVIDTTCDERCDLWEIKAYVEKKQLPIDDATVTEMFKEATSRRGYICDAQMNGPLTHAEIAAAVRGRHSWNTESKQWEIMYRPFRDHWITLLLTVNDKIFALPM